MSVDKGGMPYEKAFVKFPKFYRAQYICCPSKALTVPIMFCDLKSYLHWKLILTCLMGRFLPAKKTGFIPHQKFVFVFQNRLSPLTDKLGDVPALPWGTYTPLSKPNLQGWILKRPLWVNYLAEEDLFSSFVEQTRLLQPLWWKL